MLVALSPRLLSTGGPMATGNAQWRQVASERTSEQLAPHISASREEKHPFLVALGQRVRGLRARRGMTRKALAARPKSPSGISRISNTESATRRSSSCCRSRKRCSARWPSCWATSTTVSPEWLLIREMLEHRDEATLRRVRVAAGELLGTGGAHRRRCERARVRGSL